MSDGAVKTFLVSPSKCHRVGFSADSHRSTQMWSVDRKQLLASSTVPLMYWYSVTFEFHKFLSPEFFFFYPYYLGWFLQPLQHNVNIFLRVCSCPQSVISLWYGSVFSANWDHLFIHARRKYLLYSWAAKDRQWKTGTCPCDKLVLLYESYLFWYWS